MTWMLLEVAFGFFNQLIGYARAVRPYPEVYNYARDVVDAWADREPGKLALVAVGPDGGSPRR